MPKQTLSAVVRTSRPSSPISRCRSITGTGKRTVCYLLRIGSGALLGIGLLFSFAAEAAAVLPQKTSIRPNVFFDCEGPRCNRQYYRTEITWVNWVNDRQVADVHVIITSQSTGAGGREYLLDFLGTDPERGYETSYRFRSIPTDTDVEVLDGITNTLGVGLAAFAIEVGYRGIVSLVGPDPDESPAALQGMVSQDEVDDPWNLWVFRVNGGTEINGESTYRRINLDGGLSASRVTVNSRLSFWTNVRHNRISVELRDGEFVDTRTDWDVNGTIVQALASRWSLGIQAQTGRSVRFNQDFRAEITAALEYSVFPYEEATRRAFTFYYRIGPAYRDYIERTIYDQMEEVRWEQTLEVRFSQRQPWGNASFGAAGAHFLHDLDRHILRLNGNLDFRIIRGLSLEMGSRIAWVDDQIYISANEVTDSEALLRLQQRASSFDYEFEMGFSVQFGSIFNNAVNNRIGRRW